MRAGLVERLADYKWSSYTAYAYGKKHPYWLNTELILSQFLNENDKHRAYRDRVQKYASEEQRTWEDLRHGIFVGTENFVTDIKERFLPDIPHNEIPNQKSTLKDDNLENVLLKAAKILNFDMNLFRKSKRISKSVQFDRDLLIYVVWQMGMASNQEIGDQFGLTYSAVSQRVKVIREILDKDKKLAAKYQHIKSLIKI
jgi:chromosomal replication initiation ATPase DnaA